MEWKKYWGPRGGIGWMSLRTGRRVYRPHDQGPPGQHEHHGPDDQEPEGFVHYQHVQLAADNVDVLRKADVYRLLDQVPPEHLDAHADYLSEHRPDLATFVRRTVEEIKEERAPAGAAAETPQGSRSPELTQLIEKHEAAVAADPAGERSAEALKLAEQVRSKALEEMRQAQVAPAAPVAPPAPSAPAGAPPVSVKKLKADLADLGRKFDSGQITERVYTAKKAALEAQIAAESAAPKPVQPAPVAPPAESAPAGAPTMQSHVQRLLEIAETQGESAAEEEFNRIVAGGKLVKWEQLALADEFRKQYKAKRAAIKEAAAAKVEADTARQLQQSGRPGIGGGSIDVPMPEDRQELVRKVLANKAGRAGIESILGPAATERFYKYTVGGEHPHIAVIKAMGWDREADKAAADAPVEQFHDEAGGTTASVHRAGDGFDVRFVDKDSGNTIEIRKGFQSQAVAAEHARKLTGAPAGALPQVGDHVQLEDGQVLYVRHAKGHSEGTLPQLTLADASGKLVAYRNQGDPGLKVVPAPAGAETSGDQAARILATHTPAAGGPALAHRISEHLASGQKLTKDVLRDLADDAFGGTKGQGKYGPSQAHDAMEAGFNTHLMTQTDPKAGLDDAIAQAKMLADKVNDLPTQTTRSGNKESHQQFSTPPHYAFAVNWVANIAPGEVVLEPSAGTGCLSVHAMNAGADVYANEIDEERAAYLKDQIGQDKVFVENAEQIGAILPGKMPQPTTIVMNPPFSQTAGRMGDKKDLLEAAKHIEEAGLLLAPGGRLVAIVGRGMTPEANRYAEWFERMKGEYSLRANVGIDGDEYKKYGTHFGTRVLVFDKTGPHQGDTVTGDAEDIPDLMRMLEGVRNDRSRAAGAAVPASDGAAGGAVAGEDGGTAGAGDSGTGAVPGGDVPQPAGKRVRRPRRKGPLGPSAVGDEAHGDGAVLGGELPGAGPGDAGPGSGGNGSGLVAAHEAARQPGSRPGRRRADKGSGDSGGEPAGSGASATPALRPAQPVAVKAVPKKPVSAPAGAEDEASGISLYEEYVPQTEAGAKPHPTKLVESAAMAAVPLPEATYQPVLSPDIIEGKVLTETLPDGREKKRYLGLSAPGIEAVTYMGQAHSTEDDSGQRMGLLIGDGPGSGKGRQCVGVIADNMNQGRLKHVWVTANQRLFGDALRDWKDMGMDPSKLFSFNKLRGKAPPADGTVLVTYSLLRDGSKDPTKPKNLDILRDWLGKDFDGVVAFDEAHLMANAQDMDLDGKADKEESEYGDDEGGGSQKHFGRSASKQALAGVELQQSFPKARIGYWSGSAATETENLAFGERLGLWGPGTQFPKKMDFINEMKKGGVASLEAVAQSLKATGGYMSRTLAMDGVEVDKLEHKVTPDEQWQYDRVADAWQKVLGKIDDVLKQTAGDKNKMAQKNAETQFWGAQQRFFNQMLTSMATRSVVEAMKKDIAEGRAPVVQLVNTMEASQKRALAGREKDESLEDLDLSPKEILTNYLDQSFPIHRYEEYKDANGNTQSRLVRTTAKVKKGKSVKIGADTFAEGAVIPKERLEAATKSQWADIEGGEPVVDPKALAEREALKADVNDLRIPESPIDQIIRELGADAVSEVTGRGQRPVWTTDKDGNPIRTLENRPGGINATEIDHFMDCRKASLIFSGAGNTGASYHAKKGTGKAHKRRVHYVLQTGWSAAPLVQSLGRTHRADQESAPIVRPVGIPNIPSHKRFLSSAMRRMAQMGALTRGQSEAGSGGLFDQADNLESPEAQVAVDKFFRDLRHGRIEGLPYEDTMRKLGLGKMLEDKKTGSNRLGGAQQQVPVTRFLNRMMALPIDTQNKVFDAFSTRHMDTIEQAEQDGTLAHGVEDFQAHALAPMSERTINTHKSGAETKHLVVKATHKHNKLPWENVGKGGELVGFVKNRRSGQIWAQYKTTDKLNQEDGKLEPHYRLKNPTGGQQFVRAQKIDYGHYYNADDGGWEQLDQNDARQEWQAAYDAAPDTYDTEEHFVTGALLPVWKRIPGEDQPRIYRLKLSNGQRVVARHIKAKDLDKFRDNFGLDKPETGPVDIHAHVKAGGRALLAGGWRLKPSTVDYERRIELVGPNRYQAEQAGLLVHKIGSEWRYFVPTGDEGKAILDKILEQRPAKIEGTSMSTRPRAQEKKKMSKIKDAVAAARSIGLNVADVDTPVGFLQHLLTAAKTRRISLSRQRLARVRLSHTEPPNESAVAKCVRRLQFLCCHGWAPGGGLDGVLAEISKLPDAMVRRVAAEFGVSYLSGEKKELLARIKQHAEDVQCRSQLSRKRLSAGWTKYQGPRGGHGWKSNQTGRVLYQEKMPGENEHHGKSDEPGGGGAPAGAAKGRHVVTKDGKHLTSKYTPGKGASVGWTDNPEMASVFDDEATAKQWASKHGGEAKPHGAPAGAAEKPVAEKPKGSGDQARDILQGKDEDEMATAPPPGKVYNPKVGPDAARVGVPAKAVPPPPNVAELRLPNLAPDEREVETSWLRRIAKDHEQMADHYMAIARSRGNVFETDAVKELDPHWSPPKDANVPEEDIINNRARYNLALHQGANAICKRAFLKHLDSIPPEKKSVLVTCGGCGCHAKDTPILMADGTRKLVQDIEIGDRLMGPDSQPRTVLRRIRGHGEMYRVIPTRGRPFVVNADHVLSLKTARVRGSMKRRRMLTVNMTVADVLARGKSFQRTSLLYRTGVDFPASYVPVDPYFLGLWLGDGTHCLPAITSADAEVAEYLEQFAASVPGIRLSVQEKPSNRAAVYRLASQYTGRLAGSVYLKNPLQVGMEQIGVLRNKHIPQSYLVNSRENRLALLAGLLDSDGHLGNGYFEILTKFPALADGIEYLAGSLGFGTNVRKCHKVNTTTGIGGDYFRISVTGDVSVIPTKVKRKQADARCQVKGNGARQRDVLRTGYALDHIGAGDYYGFTLDKDGLYLMGDFTVTHNSGKGYMLEEGHEIPEVKAVADKVGAVWDSAGDQNATENQWIQEECEKRGIKVHYAYVHNDPAARWADEKRGVVQRANAKGRMITTRVMVDSYVDGAKNMQAFYEKHKDNPNANFFFVDNNNLDEKGNARLIGGIPPESLKVDKEELHNQLLKTVDERKDQLRPAVVNAAKASLRIWPDDGSEKPAQK